MKRPTFTEREEWLIAQVRNEDAGRGDRFTYYGAWVLAISVVFGYGLWDDSKPLLLTGFLLAMYHFLRFVYLQFTPSRSLKSIFEKYEAALHEADAPAAGESSQIHRRATILFDIVSGADIMSSVRHPGTRCESVADPPL